MSLYRVSIGGYFKTVTSILGEPRRYFCEGRDDTSINTTLGFLIVSAVVYTIGFSTVNLSSGLLKNVMISFINAVGMVIISSIFSYLTMAMIFGRHISFRRLFGIFARASGTTMLVSWIPSFIFLTEPWKWWLIWVGLTSGASLRWYQATVIVLMSIFWVIIFFYSLLAII